MTMGKTRTSYRASYPNSDHFAKRHKGNHALMIDRKGERMIDQINRITRITETDRTRTTIKKSINVVESSSTLKED